MTGKPAHVHMHMNLDLYLDINIDSPHAYINMHAYIQKDIQKDIGGTTWQYRQTDGHTEKIHNMHTQYIHRHSPKKAVNFLIQS